MGFKAMRVRHVQNDSSYFFSVRIYLLCIWAP